MFYFWVHAQWEMKIDDKQLRDVQQKINFKLIGTMSSDKIKRQQRYDVESEGDD